MSRSKHLSASFLIVMSIASCGDVREQPAHETEAEDQSWAVTAWSDLFEIFPECDPLVAGSEATCHTHVTVLADFSALEAGKVSAVLRDGAGNEAVFTSDAPLRDGIWNVALKPAAAGTYDLVFRVESAVASGDVPSGRVEVGTAEKPGALVTPPVKLPAPGPEAIGFLKEQQWRTPFATIWAAKGTIRDSVRGSARLRPVAGGEVVVAAPVAGVVRGEPWPYTGLAVEAGSVLLELTASAGVEQSLANLRANLAEAEAELGTARARLERMEKLLGLEAASAAEVEALRADVTRLESRRQAASLDFDSARSARLGGGEGERLSVRAPRAGRVAEVRATPGQVVAPGEALARIVATVPIWVEVGLRPVDAAKVTSDPHQLLVRLPGETTHRAPEGVRLVASAPEVDAATGTVTSILEARNPDGALLAGATAEAEILLAGTREGIVVPSESIVDDAGVPIVYVQAEGESFGRREVRIAARQGDQVLVEGVAEGERIVVRGGAAIRRASLISTGAGEGHVH